MWYLGIKHNGCRLAALGLHALQHRGQEGCGIVSFDGKKYHSEKGMVWLEIILIKKKF